MALSNETREKLKRVSTATLATALYKRGLRNQVIQGVHPVRARGVNMVGPAYTLRYIPAREDRNQLSEFRNPEHPQRVAVESCPAGHVLVMDSRKDPRAASAGAASRAATWARCRGRPTRPTTSSCGWSRCRATRPPTCGRRRRWRS